MKKMLVVSPVFYGYHSAIALAAEAIGYEVHTHLYDSAAGPMSKFENRLLSVGSGEMTSFIREQYALRAIKALRLAKPDVVLVVKGDLLGDSWWEELDRSKLPTVLWIYDELKNTLYTDEFLASRSSVASYSRSDAQHLNDIGIPAAFVPGGFDSLSSISNSQVSPYILSFIGARYPEREALLNELHKRDVQVQAFGRQWGSNLWDKARTGFWTPAPFACGPDLSRPDAYAVMRGSLASINHHGTHKGFNMRMFEACGVGGVHLIDRQDASEFYELGSEILAFDDADQAVEHLHRVQFDDIWASKIRQRAQKRTLDSHTLIARVGQLSKLVS